MTPQPLEKSQKALGFAFPGAEAGGEQAKKQQDEHTRLKQQKKQFEEDREAKLIHIISAVFRFRVHTAISQRPGADGVKKGTSHQTAPGYLGLG